MEKAEHEWEILYKNCRGLNMIEPQFWKMQNQKFGATSKNSYSSSKHFFFGKEFVSGALFFPYVLCSKLSVLRSFLINSGRMVQFSNIFNFKMI